MTAKGEVLLTTNMANKGPKGCAWVPVGEYEAVCEAWEEKKRQKKAPPPKPPPPVKAPKKVKTSEPKAPKPAREVMPPPPPAPIEPEEEDYTGLSEEEIKRKKKEAKKRKKAMILAQLEAVEAAKQKIAEQEKKQAAPAPAPVPDREGKRAAKPSKAYGGTDYFTGNIPEKPQKSDTSKGKATKKVAKRGKDGKIVTQRTLKQEEVDRNRAERKKQLMKACRETLTVTRKHKYHWVFSKPVDPIALNIPDYFDIIKEPMDFGTIKEKLDKKQYATAHDFAYDMRLVFENCATYNTPESDAGLMGNVLKGEFEKAWLNGRVDEKIAEEEMIQAEEDEIIRNTPDDPIEEDVTQVEDLNRQLAEVQKQLAMVQKQQAMGYAAPPPPMSGGGGGGGSKRKRAPVDDDYYGDEDDLEDEFIPQVRGGSRRGGGAARSGGGGASRGGGGARSQGGASAGLPGREMTYAEKQELTELLGELPDDKQGRVVQIVAERQADMGNDGSDLIEINIEELDSETLWKLDRYVRSCLKPKKRKPTQQEILMEAQRAQQEAERELMQVEQSLGVNAHASAPMPAPEVAAPTPATAPAAAPKPDDSDATSSSSSDSGSSSDSDSDSYDSAEGGGSNPKGGAAAAAAAAGGAAAATTGAAAGGTSLVEVSSSQRVDEGLALKQNQSRKEVTIQNQAGWANLADKPADTAATDAAAEPAVAIPDSLWSDFEAMAQQKSDREKEREAEEAREKAEAAAKEAAAREEEDRRRQAAVEAEQAAKRAAEEAEAEKKRQLEEERAKARAELDGMGQSVDLEAQREVMKEFQM